MRNNKKIFAGMLALAMSVGMLAGCDKNPKIEETTETTTETTELSFDLSDEDKAPKQDTRAVAEGDVHAIYKISGQPTEDFYLAHSDEIATAYINGVAKIEVFGANYKEDYQELPIYADSSCANLKFNNMLYTCDTEFEEPVNTKIAGFDAISYDYVLIVNEFVNDVKTELERHKARIIFFFSDEDVYYINVQCSTEVWDETLPKFEKFLDSVVIDKNATEPEKTEGTVDDGTVLHEDPALDGGADNGEEIMPLQ